MAADFLFNLFNPFLMSYINKLPFLFGAIMAVSTASVAKNPVSNGTQNTPAGIQVTCPANQVFAANSGANCTATIVLPTAQTIGNGCPGTVVLNYSSEMGSGNGPFYNVPTGIQIITVKAVNACGDEATCQFTATVKDQKKPSANFIKELYANLTGTGAATFNARTFDLGSSDNCSQNSALRFSFSQNPLDSVRMFDCDSVGLRPVKVFVTDESGNFTAKNSSVHISDANSTCQMVFASGKITTESGGAVENVTVKLFKTNDILSVETGETGSFKFAEIQSGQFISIAPSKNLNPTNGVSTLDLSLISRHVLGQKPLGSPLKVIAADINRNGQVTTGDLIELRKLILGEIADFPNNDSWRFVPKSHVFADPAQPFAATIPGAATFSAITNSQPELDFFGIKIGDVNADAIANNFGGPTSDDRNENEFLLKTTDREIRRGDLVEVKFTTDLALAEGLQTTLQFDINSLIFNGLNENTGLDFTEKNISTARLQDGQLPISWFHISEETVEMTNLFSVTFRATTDGKLSEMLRLGNLPTNSLVFDREGQTYNLRLIFEDGQAQVDEPAPGLSLAQNEPNPAVGETRIRFTLPENGHAELRFFDAMGREVSKMNGDFSAGDNEFRFDVAALGLPSGLYFYRLDAPSGSLAHKLDLIFR